MKKIPILILLLYSVQLSFSQSGLPEYYSKVSYCFSVGDFYMAMPILDEALKKYPEENAMYFNRGLAKYYLNERPGAIEDFLKAEKYGYINKDEFIKWISHKDYAAKILCNSYLDKSCSLKEEHNFRPVPTRKDTLQGALRPERTCYDVFFYDLSVKIVPRKKNISGNNVIHFLTKTNTRKIQIDLDERYKILSLTLDGRPQKFTRDCNAVFVNFDNELASGKKYALSVRYEGKPAEAINPPWNGGFVWKKNHGNCWAGVACEHLGASSWWPCKDHLSDKPDSMRIHLQVPDDYFGVANGNLMTKKPGEKGFTNYEWFVSYPINTYGVTFYVGKFINFQETYIGAKDSMSMDFYVLEHNLETAKKFYSQTKDIIQVYEKLYGPFPYRKDGVGMVEAPYTGMENQTAIAIGDEYGSNMRRNYVKIDYDYLLIHETAHEWWGNAVTMADMADAWISEGFATYSEHLFVEQKYGYDDYIKVCAENMLEVENIWPMVGAYNVNDNAFLGGDVYNKGAAMLHNFRCELNNDSLFFSTIKGYFSKFIYQPISTKDFIDYFNSATGKDYSDFFSKFLYDADLPVLHYKMSIKNDTLKFTYNWTHVGKNFTMPFGIMVNDYKSIRLEGTTDPQSFILPKVKSFYIPNEIRFKKNEYVRNSFTYFWTEWEH